MTSKAPRLTVAPLTGEFKRAHLARASLGARTWLVDARTPEKRLCPVAHMTTHAEMDEYLHDLGMIGGGAGATCPECARQRAADRARAHTQNSDEARLAELHDVQAWMATIISLRGRC